MKSRQNLINPYHDKCVLIDIKDKNRVLSQAEIEAHQYPLLPSNIRCFDLLKPGTGDAKATTNDYVAFIVQFAGKQLASIPRKTDAKTNGTYIPLTDFNNLRLKECKPRKIPGIFKDGERVSVKELREKNIDVTNPADLEKHGMVLTRQQTTVEKARKKNKALSQDAKDSKASKTEPKQSSAKPKKDKEASKNKNCWYNSVSNTIIYVKPKPEEAKNFKQMQYSEARQEKDRVAKARLRASPNPLPVVRKVTALGEKWSKAKAGETATHTLTGGELLTKHKTSKRRVFLGSSTELTHDNIALARQHHIDLDLISKETSYQATIARDRYLVSAKRKPEILAVSTKNPKKHLHLGEIDHNNLAKYKEFYQQDDNGNLIKDDKGSFLLNLMPYSVYIKQANPAEIRTRTFDSKHKDFLAKKTPDGRLERIKDMAAFFADPNNFKPGAFQIVQGFQQLRTASEQQNRIVVEDGKEVPGADPNLPLTEGQRVVQKASFRKRVRAQILKNAEADESDADLNADEDNNAKPKRKKIDHRPSSTDPATLTDSHSSSIEKSDGKETKMANDDGNALTSSHASSSSSAPMRPVSLPSSSAAKSNSNAQHRVQDDLSDDLSGEDSEVVEDKTTYTIANILKLAEMHAKIYLECKSISDRFFLPHQKLLGSKNFPQAHRAYAARFKERCNELKKEITHAAQTRARMDISKFGNQQLDPGLSDEEILSHLSTKLKLLCKKNTSIEESATFQTDGAYQEIFLAAYHAEIDALCKEHILDVAKQQARQDACKQKTPPQDFSRAMQEFGDRFPLFQREYNKHFAAMRIERDKYFLAFKQRFANDFVYQCYRKKFPKFPDECILLFDTPENKFDGKEVFEKLLGRGYQLPLANELKSSKNLKLCLVLDPNTGWGVHPVEDIRYDSKEELMKGVAGDKARIIEPYGAELLSLNTALKNSHKFSFNTTDYRLDLPKEKKSNGKISTLTLDGVKNSRHGSLINHAPKHLANCEFVSIENKGLVTAYIVARVPEPRKGSRITARNPRHPASVVIGAGKQLSCEYRYLHQSSFDTISLTDYQVAKDFKLTGEEIEALARQKVANKAAAIAAAVATTAATASASTSAVARTAAAVTVTASSTASSATSNTTDSTAASLVRNASKSRPSGASTLATYGFFAQPLTAATTATAATFTPPTAAEIVQAANGAPITRKNN